MFSLTQISLLEAETGDTSQPVYTSLWALFVPKSAKEPNLLSSTRPDSHTKLANRFHTANRS